MTDTKLTRRAFAGGMAALGGSLVAGRRAWPASVERADGVASDLAVLARAGLAARFAGAPPEPYSIRLDDELSRIARESAERPFLVAHEAVAFARRRGITVGPGHGSTPNSLVAWAIGITAIDPLRQVTTVDDA